MPPVSNFEIRPLNLLGGIRIRTLAKKRKGLTFFKGFQGENARKNNEKPATVIENREIKGLTFLVLNFSYFPFFQYYLLVFLYYIILFYGAERLAQGLEARFSYIVL